MEQNLFIIFRNVVFLKLRYKNFKWTVATNVKIYLALKFVYKKFQFTMLSQVYAHGNITSQPTAILVIIVITKKWRSG